MEKIKLKIFAQKLSELKKSEIKKVDELFCPQVQVVANKNNAAFAIFHIIKIIKEKAKSENRPLSEEETEIEKKF